MGEVESGLASGCWTCEKCSWHNEKFRVRCYACNFVPVSNSTVHIGGGPTIAEESKTVHERLIELDKALQGLSGPDQQRIAETGVKWLLTLLAKNRDYGGSAWRRPVLAPQLRTGDAILCRMSDKVERLQKLLRDGNPAVAESIEDTMSDLGSYCLLWLARPNRGEQHADQ